MQIHGLSSQRMYTIGKSAKWGMSDKIQAKAQATVDRVVTDRLKDRITSMAQEDAEQGDYMGSEFKQMRLSYMHKYVSPDISQPLAQTSSWIAEAVKEKSPELELLDALLGGCTVECRVTSEAQNASIYSEDGEMLASYNSLGGGWTILRSKAETKFLSETTALYSRAYSEAKAAQTTQTSAAQAVPAAETAVDVRA